MRRCKHPKTRKWVTKAGYTEKCLACGRRRKCVVVEEARGLFREFIPGTAETQADGTVVFDLIDVTTLHHPVKVQTGDWA